MNVLALDTASPTPAVSLSAGDRLFVEALPPERRASEELLPAISRALASAGLDLADCHRIAVCAGPGSFTGIRVGLATAWSFGRALGIPVEAVPTLEAMAETARASGAARVTAVLDAGRSERVFEVFDLAGPRARSLGASARIPAPDAAGLGATGPVVELPRDPSRPDAGGPATSVAGALARAVARAPGEASGMPASAIYTRPSAAEEKRVAP